MYVSVVVDEDGEEFAGPEADEFSSDFELIGSILGLIIGFRGE